MGKKSNYAVVLDAGSSGTRAHIYKWADASVARKSATEKEWKTVPKVTTKKEWTKKIKPGISTFVNAPKAVGSDHLKPLLDHVLNILPAEAVKTTPIYLLGTAGMRLIPKSEQTKILGAVCTYIRENSELLIPNCDLHIKVIDGKTEGLYGWIATNYLLGGFDSPPQLGQDNGHETFGFLDMGGASAQLAFVPNATETEKHSNDLTLLRLRTVNGRQAEYRVFVTSWLGFGVRQARSRYVKALLNKNKGSSGDNHSIHDPCLPEGLRTTTEGEVLSLENKVSGGQSFLEGTGEFDDCMLTTIPLLEKDVPCSDEPCLLNGVHVPAIDFDMSRFVGISEYWHTTNEIFEAGYKNKAYDFETYQQRVKDFCGQKWGTIQEGVANNKWGKTDERAAYEVCFKAAWIMNVLHDGIGIPRTIEPIFDSKNSTTNAKSNKNKADHFQAINKIGSTEATWALGKAILCASSQIKPNEGALPVGIGSNVAEGKIPDDFEYADSSLQPEMTGSIGNGTSEHLGDTLFDGDSPRRIPGLFLFLLIILIAIYFLCGRERRTRIYRKLGIRGRCCGLRIRTRKGALFGGTDSLRGERGGMMSSERLIEEGRDFFEIDGLDSGEDSDTPQSLLRGRDTLSPMTDYPSSTHSLGLRGNGSAVDLRGPSTSRLLGALDHPGFAARAKSSETLPLSVLTPTSNGRRSRAASPTRHGGLTPI